MGRSGSPADDLGRQNKIHQALPFDEADTSLTSNRR